MDAEKKSRAAIRKNSVIGKTQSAIGWFIVVFCVLGILGFNLEPVTPFTSNDIIILAVFIAIGVFSIYCGLKRKKLDKSFKLYANLIYSQQTTSIIRLAQNTGESTDTVIKRLTKMIDKGFFVNAHLDLNRSEIVLGHGTWQPQYDSQHQQNYAQQNQSAQMAYQQPRTISVKCSGCGAMNTKYEGTTSVCEYCGTSF